MDFYAVLDQAVDLLRQRGRVTYRALKLQFQLDDDQLEALKDELLYAHPQVSDDAGRGLTWTGAPEAAPPAAVAPTLAQDQAPLTYTPPHLAEKILTSRAALEGERKQVTVLFADLKGSMELLAERDPEEARHLLDPVLDRMMAAVHQYEGTVNQVMGDGIMALFGAPLAHEDHAVRACYAALRMQEAVKQYATEVQRSHGVPIHIRVGLNAGEVVVRSIGSDLHMDYTAVGQTTHLAARKEQMAMSGAVLITPAVLGLVEGFVQVKALGAMPVRGLRDSVEVYEVTGAGMVRSRLQAAAARGLTRFVGRQPELETLQQALVQARAGHGQVVAMVGEAGVGKSRLLYEFGHSHYTQGWLVLESASVSYGKATPYFPVIDLLKRYCHVEERDDHRTIRAKVTGQLLTLDETLHETLPALLARRQGELPRAIPALERSLALCQSANFPRLFPVVAAILGMAYALAGRAPEAVALLDQALQHLATGSRVIFHAQVLTELSEALLLVGRVEEAGGLAGRLLTLSRTHPGRGYQAHASRLLGEVAMRRESPDLDQATAHYRQALALAEEVGMRPLQAHCHLGLGTFYARTGQRQQAHAELSAAIDLYRAMDMTFWLPQAEVALAQVEKRAG